MLEFFKENPNILLDAIPTPRAEEQDALADFKSGLTPKKNFSFKFGEQSQMGN